MGGGLIKSRVHNLSLKTGNFFFVMLMGQNLNVFRIKRMCYERNKLNKQNFWLCGLDKERDTFGPRAICCACLV